MNDFKDLPTGTPIDGAIHVVSRRRRLLKVIDRILWGVNGRRVK